MHIEDRGKVLPDLQCCAHGIYGLEESREDKDKTDDHSGDLCKGMSWMDHASVLLSLIRQKRA